MRTQQKCCLDESNSERFWFSQENKQCSGLDLTGSWGIWVKSREVLSKSKCTWAAGRLYDTQDELSLPSTWDKLAKSRSGSPWGEAGTRCLPPLHVPATGSSCPAHTNSFLYWPWTSTSALWCPYLTDPKLGQSPKITDTEQEGWTWGPHFYSLHCPLPSRP